VCRFNFLHIVCHYEHYIPLNLPLKSDAREEATAGTMKSFEERHFLAALLLNNVFEAIDVKSDVE
jgi:hypothetical protein